MTLLQKKLNEIHQQLPEHVTLVAVSKYHPEEKIEEAYTIGQRVFGESRPQEMLRKANRLPQDIQWHFIGNLQTNKVKMVVPHATLIHSVSSEKLLKVIQKEAAKLNKQAHILLELHVAQEESKQGFSPEALYELITPEFIETLPNITFCGVMGMATNTRNDVEVREEFQKIKACFDHLKSTNFQNHPDFKEISMGMSHDYQIAIQEGATLVRIGTSIFGQREY